MERMADAADRLAQMQFVWPTVIFFACTFVWGLYIKKTYRLTLLQTLKVLTGRAIVDTSFFVNAIMYALVVGILLFWVWLMKECNPRNEAGEVSLVKSYKCKRF